MNNAGCWNTYGKTHGSVLKGICLTSYRNKLKTNLYCTF